MKRFEKLMRSAATIIILLAAAIPCTAGDSYRGRKSMGIYGGYATGSESAVAGIYFNYRFARSFILAPSADYVFRHSDEDGFNIDLNALVPFAVNSAGTVSLYPIGGIGYSAFNDRHSDILLRTTDDSRHRTDRFGLNVGGGAEWLVSPTLRLSFEGKWRWRTDYSTGLLTLSIGYMF